MIKDLFEVPTGEEIELLYTYKISEKELLEFMLDELRQENQPTLGWSAARRAMYNQTWNVIRIRIEERLKTIKEQKNK